MTALSAFVKERRELKGILPEDFAKACDLNPSMISRIEGGQVERPRQKTLVKLAKGLGLSIEELQNLCKSPEPFHIPKGESFGKKLGDYRDVRLKMTQTEFANTLSKTELYTISQDDVANWENNKNLDQINRALYAIIETTLVEQARTAHWSEEEISGMKKELRDAYEDRLKYQNNQPENAFSKKLTYYREKLGMTQQEFAGALTEDAMSRDYVAHIEGGGRPSTRFILASADLLQNPGGDRKPAMYELERAEYVALGIAQRNQRESEALSR